MSRFASRGPVHFGEGLRADVGRGSWGKLGVDGEVTGRRIRRWGRGGVGGGKGSLKPLFGVDYGAGLRVGADYDERDLNYR
jgi:hypothetical protein